MKKILITGGTGFIGSHLAEKCIKKGYHVTVFDRYNVNYNLGNLSNSIYKKKIKFVFGDIRDFDSVDNVVKKMISFYISQHLLEFLILIYLPMHILKPILKEPIMF